MGGIFPFFKKKTETPAGAAATPGEPQQGHEEDGPEKAKSHPDPVKRVYPNLPTVKGAGVQRGSLFFTCPGCGELNRLSADVIHPVLGVRVVCSSCGTLVHISGFDPFSMRASEIIINSGVPVRLIEFDDWYNHHPVTESLRQRHWQESHIEYGLWVYCIRCHHEFSAAMLMNIPPVWDPRLMQRSGMDKTQIRELAAIKSGRCPACGNGIVMVIITDIPDRVRHMIEDQEYSWSSED
jgi:uncharacterized protein (DUF983 family)